MYTAGTSEEALLEAFIEIDKNGNGKLDKAEIGAALRKLGKSDQQIFYILQVTYSTICIYIYIYIYIYIAYI